MNLRKLTVKFRTVVYEVSFFVGNPVYEQENPVYEQETRKPCIWTWNKKTLYMNMKQENPIDEQETRKSCI